MHPLPSGPGVTIHASKKEPQVSLGREALNWSAETWTAIDRAMHEENLRAGVTAKVIPLLGPLPDALAVPAETIDAGTMTVDEDRLLPLVELSIEFALTRKQVDLEHELGTAVTLTRRAASLLTQAEDLAVLQGDAALANGQLPNRVRVKGATGPGLVAAATDTIGGDGGPEGIFRAVAEAYALLQARSHTGPYGLLLEPERYAATVEPVEGTSVLVSERIRGLVQGFFGTAALPEDSGVLVSVGGDTIDLVVGADPALAFLAIDGDDRFRFRVFERFALRVKDPSACVRLELAGRR
jgi:uncharacterized linocin/CFP29 family protein